MQHRANIKNIKVGVNVFILKEDDLFVAYCPALELSSYGETKDEAKESFKQAMHILIEDTQRKGTLEKLLLSLGWTLRLKPNVSYQPPVLPDDKIKEFKAYISSQLTEQLQIPV